MLTLATVDANTVFLVRKWIRKVQSTWWDFGVYFRRHIMLLPDHVQTATKRSIRYTARSIDTIAGGNICFFASTSKTCVSFLLGKNVLDIARPCELVRCKALMFSDLSNTSKMFCTHPKDSTWICRFRRRTYIPSIHSNHARPSRENLKNWI